MNTGLQDAYNLGWKLALVVSGRAGAALLHSYEDERLPVATHLLNRTDRLFSLIVSDSGLAGFLRTAPALYTRFNLLVFGQPAPPGGVSGLGDLLRIHEVPSDSANDRELARVRIPRPSFYLLRPDGHVGLAGTRLDAGAATRHVAERLHLAITGA
jgi:hypothetical protein